MYNLSDCLAFLSELDVPTLRLFIPEACRILAERERNAAMDVPGANISASLTMRSH
jgi:hypothetical protein